MDEHRAKARQVAAAEKTATSIEELHAKLDRVLSDPASSGIEELHDKLDQVGERLTGLEHQVRELIEVLTVPPPEETQETVPVAPPEEVAESNPPPTSNKKTPKGS